MSDSNEFPRLLYRKGDDGEHQVWGHKVDLREVHDAEQLKEALGAGWTLRPDGHNDEPKQASEFALLDEPVKAIKAELPKLTDEELLTLLEAEQRGKTRKGVVEALEEAVASRQPPAPVAEQPPAE